MTNRKILVIDTSVLLYDMSAIHSFPGNDVILPLTVLDELDRFKDKPGLLGESARYVNRYLDGLRNVGQLHKSVKIPDSDQTIRVETKFPKSIPVGLATDIADNKIIATALALAKTNPDCCVKVITKDINLRVKCDALNLLAEDYYKDHIGLSKLSPYKGVIDYTLDDDDIDSFFSQGSIDVEDSSEKLFENQFIIGTSHSGKSLLGIYKKGAIQKIPKSEIKLNVGFEPRNKEQRFAANLLMDSNIQLVTLTGIAGSGKTFITLMSAVSGLLEGKYKRIIVTRSIQPVGRDLGYLPGDMNEKMAPWMAPITDNFRHAFKDMAYYHTMRQSGDIEIAPLAYIRGRTFNDAFVIVDEAQNASIHELKTVITRIGKGSKIVLLGDTDQIDTPYLDKISNGLSIVAQRFKKSEYSGHVHLINGQRSEIATLASSIL